MSRFESLNNKEIFVGYVNYFRMNAIYTWLTVGPLHHQRLRGNDNFYSIAIFL